jgi:arylsulfatase A-like enzyme
MEVAAGIVSPVSKGAHPLYRLFQLLRPKRWLQGGGLRYTQMHNTALCSPTRAALLTGRNHHNVGYVSALAIIAD